MAQLSTRFVEKVARNEVQRGAWCLLRYEKQPIFRSFLSLFLYTYIYIHISLLSLVAARKRETSRRSYTRALVRARERASGAVSDHVEKLTMLPICR